MIFKNRRFCDREEKANGNGTFQPPLNFWPRRLHWAYDTFLERGAAQYSKNVLGAQCSLQVETLQWREKVLRIIKYNIRFVEFEHAYYCMFKFRTWVTVRFDTHSLPLTKTPTPNSTAAAVGLGGIFGSGEKSVDRLVIWLRQLLGHWIRQLLHPEVGIRTRLGPGCWTQYSTTRRVVEYCVQHLAGARAHILIMSLYSTFGHIIYQIS